MKASTGLWEIITIMGMMIAAIPLLLSLMIVCNSTSMKYLNDKSAMEIQTIVEYDIVRENGIWTYTPKFMFPVSIDYGGAQALAVINDDYCPEEGRIVRYAYGTGLNKTTRATVPATAGQLTISDGWRSIKDARWRIQLNGSGAKASSLKASMANKPLYLVWNTYSKQWMITDVQVNMWRIGD